MTPTEQLAARWLADVPKHNAQDAKSISGYAANVWVHEADALAAIAQRLTSDGNAKWEAHLNDVLDANVAAIASGDDLVEPLHIRRGMTNAPWEDGWTYSVDDGFVVHKRGPAAMTFPLEVGMREFVAALTAKAAAIAAIASHLARHLAPGDDLAAQATAALEGVTEGPWEADANENGAFTIDAFDGNTRILCSRAPWPSYAKASQANARFIAFTRQWVPEAAARIAALTATVDGLKNDNAAMTAAHDMLGRYWTAAVERADAAEAEAATLRARLARMEGALEKVAQHGGYEAKIARAALIDGGTPK